MTENTLNPLETQKLTIADMLKSAFSIRRHRQNRLALRTAQKTATINVSSRRLYSLKGACSRRHLLFSVPTLLLI